MRDAALNTVCQEAGCPNIFECWADRTATFMILGDRCTRACGFCLVDTRRPAAARPRRAGARGRRGRPLGLAHAVVTSVARDDLARRRRGGLRRDDRRDPATRTGHRRSKCSSRTARATRRRARTIFAARPDVLNHNLETVARLQRAGASVGGLRAFARRCSAAQRRPGS